MQKLIHPGLVTTLVGSQMGSEAKALVSAFLTSTHRPSILLAANGANASHTVVDTSVKRHKSVSVFKVLPAGAFYYGIDGYTPKIYLGPGSAFRVKDFYQELEENKIPIEAVRVHPNATIIQDIDSDYENGIRDFDGKRLAFTSHESGTTKYGTTGSGTGAARARKSLRKAQIARDVLDCCEDSDFVLRHLKDGGLLDGSQGYFLSLYEQFYPHTTSRSTSVASFFAEMDLPLSLAGDVVGVGRTMPIRINRKRFYDPETASFLTWDETKEYEKNGRPFDVVDSDSGSFFEDQCELHWDEVSEFAGRHIPVEKTTLTKLPRVIATWSKIAFEKWLRKNEPPFGRSMHYFLTFTNYIGHHPDNGPEGLAKLNDFIESSGIAQAVASGDLKSLWVTNTPETNSPQEYTQQVLTGGETK